MAKTTKIEWCDSTWNPWVGCTKVSPACDHCYAEVSTPSRTRGIKWGAGKPRQRTSAANWKLPLRWNARPFWQCSCGYRGDDEGGGHNCTLPLASPKPARRRVFCASLADVFDNEVPAQWRADLFALIEATPNLDWLLLTKRIGNWQKQLQEAATYRLAEILADSGDPKRDVLYQWIRAWLDNKPHANVWIGATICNQAEADRDVPKLLRVPAAVRFLSIEPMLGKIDFYHTSKGIPPDGHPWRGTPILHGIHWIIAGSESGIHASPSHPDWFRSLRDQCAAADVPFLFKQWGEWVNQAAAGLDLNLCYDESKIGGWVEMDGQWSAGDNAAPHAPTAAHVFRIGKKLAGRTLNGMIHNGFPRNLPLR